jgi:hypothetical protein
MECVANLCTGLGREGDILELGHFGL